MSVISIYKNKEKYVWASHIESVREKRVVLSLGRQVGDITQFAPVGSNLVFHWTKLGSYQFTVKYKGDYLEKQDSVTKDDVTYALNYYTNLSESALVNLRVMSIKTSEAIKGTGDNSFLKLMADEFYSTYPEIFKNEGNKKLLQHFLPQIKYKEELSNYLNLLIKYYCNNPKSFATPKGDKMFSYDDYPLPSKYLVHLVLYYISNKDKGVAMVGFLYGLSTQELVEEYQEFLEVIFQAYKKINNDLWAVNFIIETLNEKTQNI